MDPSNNKSPAAPSSPPENDLNLTAPHDPLLTVPPAPTTGFEPTPQPAIQSQAYPPHTYEKRTWLVKSLKIALFAILVWISAVILNTFVFQSYFVEGMSMAPTLSDNDRLVVSKLSKTMATLSQNTYVPGRGEIVVIHSAALTLPGSSPEQIVKRVIGLPGERVMIQDGQITVFNQEFPNGFNPDETLNLNVAPSFTSQAVDTVVPPGEIFVMGDNRAEGGSFDSREFGTVPSGEVVGELVMRVLPINHIQVF